MVEEYAIEQIKDRIDIVELISHYVKLKKKGQNYTGLCPFHQEKTPSFVVSPVKRIYHCFGCGEGGNAIGFLMKIENLSFIEAIRLLAKQAGIEIDESKFSGFKDKDDYKSGFEMLERIAQLYQTGIEEKKSFDYLKLRGLTPEIIQQFKVGYADRNRFYAFVSALSSEEKKIVLEVGVAVETEKGLADRFAERLIFPIVDIQNRTVGFGGRILDSAQKAKYVNSPDNKYYHKGDVLYGLNIAKQFIKENNEEIILVEGYMDTISLHQAGIKNVAAISGTALTSKQLNILERYVKSVCFCFDSDEAGLNAVVRVHDLVQSSELNFKVVVYAEAKDPDEFIKKFGVEKFREKISEAIPYREFLINEKIKNFKNKQKLTPEDKSALIKELRLILKLKDDILKNHYVEFIAESLNVPIDSIRPFFFEYSILAGQSRRIYKQKDLKKGKYFDFEKNILSILFCDISLRNEFLDSFKLEYFLEPENKTAFSILLKNRENDLQTICSLSDFKNLTDICFEEKIDDSRKYLEQALLAIQKRERESEIYKLKLLINQLEKNGDFDKLNESYKRLTELTRKK